MSTSSERNDANELISSLGFSRRMVKLDRN